MTIKAATKLTNKNLPRRKGENTVTNDRNN